MYIQIYTGNFFPEKTGIGKYTGEMALWLAKAGHRVEVITGFPYYPEWRLGEPYSRTGFKTESWQGVTIRRVPHYIPGDGKVTSARRMLVDFSLLLSTSWHGLRTLFSRKPPDVMMAICPPLFSGVWPMLISKLRRRPWIYHVQDYQVDAAVQLGMLKPRLLGKLLLTAERVLMRSASVTSSITPAMCRKAQSKGVAQQRSFELANWSDLSRVYPVDRNTGFRREWGLGPERTVVMYAGAMGRKQGLEIVLDAAEALMAEPQYQFIMVGSGSDAEALQQAASRRALTNMRFLPLQPLERLNELLGSGDIHLVIQKADAADLVMPSKLTNILAAGRPAVATAVANTALWDAVQGSGTGIAIQPDDAASLIAAIQGLAAAPERAARLGMQARAYAERHLDQDAILKRFDELLGRLAATPWSAQARFSCQSDKPNDGLDQAQPQGGLD